MGDTNTQSLTVREEALPSIARALKCIILVLEFSEELVEFLVVESMHVVCELMRKLTVNGLSAEQRRKFTSCNIVCTIAPTSRKVSGAQAGRSLKRIFSPPFTSKMMTVRCDESVFNTRYSLSPAMSALGYNLQDNLMHQESLGSPSKFKLSGKNSASVGRTHPCFRVMGFTSEVTRCNMGKARSAFKGHVFEMSKQLDEHLGHVERKLRSSSSDSETLGWV